MPEGPDGKTIIIVKKVSGHGGHHGGAWKVAYADFVTAMMALFMVLWLVNSAAEPTRQRIASYFRKPGIFQKGSGTPLESGGAGILPETFAPPADENSQVRPSKRIYDVDAHSGKVREYFDSGDGKDQSQLQLEEGGSGQESKPDAAEVEMADKEIKEVEEVLEELKEAIAKAAASDSSSLGEIDIQIDQRGLLIEIMDTESASMFEVGSSKIADSARDQLWKIASILKDLPNPLDIEGHTDARPYRGKQADRYDNWNLSVDRANAARRLLQEAGMKDELIARVVGYADQRPKVPANPLDASNRRITIAMRFTELAQKALQGTKTVETNPRQIDEPKPRSSAGSAGPPSTPAAVGDTAAKPGATAAEVNVPTIQSVPGIVEEAPPKAEAEPKRPELRVEVETTLPEGRIMQPGESSSSARPTAAEKDKIFGRDNAFFE